MENSEKRPNNERNDKRRQILDGALTAFARKGFYNTRISEIANEAGVGDGTIYLYFKNKDDLLISLFEDRMEWITRELKAALAEVPPSFRPRFEALVRFHAELSIRQRELCEFMTVELRQTAKFVRDWENQQFLDYISVIHDLVLQGKEEGVVRPDADACITTRLLFGSLDDVILFLTLSHASREEVNFHIEQVCQTFLGGLLNPDLKE